jgi:hypothetical protein
VHHDDNADPPWKREDGHGPVSDWTSRSKRPGERVLSEDHGSRRYYDVEAALKLAKRDGWGAYPYGQGTKAEQAARAVDRDFAVLRAWCQDEWHYVGITISVCKAGVRLAGPYEHALWGIECNYPSDGNPERRTNGYLLEVANELLPEALDAARAKLAELAALAGEARP